MHIIQQLWFTESRIILGYLSTAMASSLSAQQIYQELVADIETLAQTQQELFNQLQIGELEHQKVNIFSDKATVEKDSQQLQRSDHETKKTTTADACTQTSFESSLKTTPSKCMCSFFFYDKYSIQYLASTCSRIILSTCLYSLLWIATAIVSSVSKWLHEIAFFIFFLTLAHLI